MDETDVFIQAGSANEDSKNEQVPRKYFYFSTSIRIDIS